MASRKALAVIEIGKDKISTTITPDPPHPPTTNSQPERPLSTSNGSIPEPGWSYIIRSAACGRALTLLHGNVVLRPMDSIGCKMWTCVWSKGWLGLRNISSGLLVGRDDRGYLCCVARVHSNAERMHVRHMAQGGYEILLVRSGSNGALWSIDTKNGRGEEELVLVDGEESSGLLWKLTKVSTT